MAGKYWTEEELSTLLHQVVIERKSLPELHIPGKSVAAINNQRRRLKEAGQLAQTFTGRKLAPWTIHELRELVKLTREYGFSAAFIAQLQLIPGRSKDAVGKMMGRHGLGDPAIKARAHSASRLSAQQRLELEEFLRLEGRLQSSAAIARRWGIAVKTVNSYRRRLGLALSWGEARASAEYRRQREIRQQRLSAEVTTRWEQWRMQRDERMQTLRRQLEHSANAPARRRCIDCEENWFATRQFFYVTRRQRGGSITFSMSHTCRMCRSQQRRAASKVEVPLHRVAA